MIKRYIQHERDRWNRHPKLYTALIVAYVVGYIWSIAYQRKLEAEINELFENL